MFTLLLIILTDKLFTNAEDVHPTKQRSKIHPSQAVLLPPVQSIDFLHLFSFVFFQN